uniref:AraC family transcriptional regulator n=1 Tax=Phenylobacterium sp. TaxID=1871053 RepID=UPI002FCB6B19
MSLTSRALWTIDRNLSRELSLAGIAEACGVSRHHLAHTFREVAGRPVMDYVRSRRLSEAAVALAGGAGDILGLALESGYASHEAFSRAFRAQFGATPEAVRRRGSTKGLVLSGPVIAPSRTAPGLPPPRFASAGEILAAGLSQRCAFEDGPTITGIWRQFGPRFGEVENRVQPIPIGVVADPDDEGRFAYTAAAEVRDFFEVPGDLSRLRIPPRDYAVFAHDDHVSTIRQTYRAIWNDWLPDNGKTLADAAT